MSGEFIKTSTNPDFFKDFEIEDPATAIAEQETELEKLKDKIQNQETREKPLDELVEELEKEEDPDKTKQTKEEEKVEEQNKVETTEPEYSFKPFIEVMAESGVLDIPEGIELGDTAEDLVEAFESTVNTRINSGIEEYKESIPELGKQFLEYLENGGDPKRFLQSQTGPIDFATVDTTDEANQKMLIREYLKLQDYTSEEIKEALQDYEDGLVLEKEAKRAAKKLEAYQSKQTELLIKEQEREVKERERALAAYVSDIQKIIKESKEIAGLEINDKEKKEFEAYLFKKDKQGLSSYQKELNENPSKTQVELAYLKFKKYDFAKAAKKGENTAAKKIRDSIISRTEQTVKGSTAQDVPKTDLSAFSKWYETMKKQ